MKNINRYASIRELKASSEPIDVDSMDSKERHEQFAHALRVLRAEYLQSRAAFNNQASVSGSPAHEL